ncbi:monovalent cation/H(+) antiporter subunit G [Pseudacidovorax sp. RU35E]|uniref:monovalent cation/H(+) antiporter subunit G n=1 Tax=Pseudacidovorax sp. RU35E TaxID=1907403 RepID=UPI000954DA10|nr:monovalent cation/H(+) antiporter subunit G [Pseudacidovorax sp. RU35E]SIR04432.1 multisubunit potassium/proton antiporter, PhaG subunit [Pseudacidovorax sp. RU35E]
MSGPLPWWAEALTALLVVVGAGFAAIGSFGLVRMPTFFRRIHTPTLGATAGVWSISLATAVYFSAQGSSLFLHAALIAMFVALTAPITTIFLTRAALFRERQKGGDVPRPAATRGEDDTRTELQFDKTPD